MDIVALDMDIVKYMFYSKKSLRSVYAYVRVGPIWKWLFRKNVTQQNYMSYSYF